MHLKKLEIKDQLSITYINRTENIGNKNLRWNQSLWKPWWVVHRIVQVLHLQVDAYKVFGP